MGFILDPVTGKKSRVHALIFTAVVSRHMFVWFNLLPDVGREDRWL